jgi:peptide/nickel transport system permease protein
VSSIVGTADDVGGKGIPVESPKFLRRLLRKPLAVVCVAFVLGVVGIAIFAPILLPDAVHEGAGDLLHSRQGPSGAHPLGTDTLGRDVLERLLVGTRPVVVGAFEALLVSLAVTVPIGLVAGYVGGRFDRAVGRYVDVSMSLPAVIVILVVLSVFPNSLLAAMTTLGILVAPAQIRVLRGAVMPVREELYIAAARVAGLSRPYIIVRHVFPRIVNIVIVNATLFAAAAITVNAGLAYLGALDPAVASWGGMFKDGTSVMLIQPWLIWPPGLAIAFTGMALALLGDSVRDATTEAWSAPMRRRRFASGSRTTVAQKMRPDAPLLSVEGLGVAFSTHGHVVSVLDDVNFTVAEGEVVGLVGESGCGKTVTSSAILGLLPANGEVTAGSIYYRGCDLTRASETALERMRGREIALISQEPVASFNPTFRVGWQIAQVVRHTRGVSRTEARKETIELLRRVHLHDPQLVAERYVHELSGGMAQRVAIARALAGEPKLLIADEPTTALDVTVQAEILDLLRDLQTSQGMAILLVTHDWGVVTDLCDRAIVMYAGEIVEQSPIRSIFREPRHPYTEALLASTLHNAPESQTLPTIPGAVPRPGSRPVGCRFHPRCTRATAECTTGAVAIEHVGLGRETRCIHHDELAIR